ncbi:MAG TPA: ShlB/FhaC/HecB family hemolysin secretion/activation protein [Burkholderiales bacterium]|nr:ShlB/FhaC/HecB family hemolysin secretion/activation protein [Burkholderiales bacterium]
MTRLTRAKRVNLLRGAVSAALLALALACPAHAQDGPRFAVRSFDIEGELPIPRERALAIVAPYTGDAVDLDRLQEAVKALEGELAARGFPFYRVVLPPQSLDGVAVIRVLPFRLANVNVTGNQYFSRENVLASLPALKANSSPNIAEVGRNRSAANEHPSKTVEVTFRQSETPDSVDADVAVTDLPPQSFFLGLNNTGEPRTGHWRASVGYQHSNLWNRDHSLTASYTTSPDHFSDVKQYGFYYRIPFYSVSGALTLFYAFSDVNSGTVAGAFQVSGRGRFSGVHWRQHLTPFGAYSHALEAGIDDRFFDNSVDFSGQQIGVDVRSRPATLQYNARYDTANSIVAGNVQYVRNLGGGKDNNDTAYIGNRAGASPDWDALRYGGDLNLRVSTVLLSARLRGQISNEPLIPGEQFGMGGALSLRGLREREVVGDSGITGTVEALVPLPLTGFSALAFVDGGEVRSREIAAGTPSHQAAFSAGVGIRWNLPRRMSLGIDAAHVLDGTTTTSSGDRRVHASVVIRF